MTGLERLRNVANAMRGYTVHGGGSLDLELMGIADRIERETAHDHSKEVSMSVYDLLPEEDRKAIAWVREKGGVNALSMGFQDADNRRIELCSSLGIDLATGWADAMAAMRRRLMPEGMEWPCYEDGEPVRIGDEFECWCGETHTVGSVTIREGRSTINESQPHSFVVSNGPFTAHGKRVKRPAVLAADGEPLEPGQTVWTTRDHDEFTVVDPSSDEEGFLSVKCTGKDGKTYFAYPGDLTHQRPVLDADGNRIEPAMDVWWVCEGDERGIHAEKLHVEGIDEDGMVECSPYNGGTSVVLDPTELYVNRPVLDADGVPIHEGDTVYSIETGEPVTVNCVEGGNPWFGTTDGTIRHCSKFTHRAPVLAADGVPIKAGDEVWTLDGGGPYTVTEPDPEHMHARVTCNTHDGKLDWGFEVAYLTHSRPEPPDSWECIEEDKDLNPFEYCKEVGHKLDTCENAERFKANDIVRRCKRLAGVS